MVMPTKLQQYLYCSSYLPMSEAGVSVPHKKLLHESATFDWRFLCPLAFCSPEVFQQEPALKERLSGDTVDAAAPAGDSISRFDSVFGKYFFASEAGSKFNPDTLEGYYEIRDIGKLLADHRQDINKAASPAAFAPASSFIPTAALNFNSPMFRLTEEDIILEGLDFHCCPDMTARVLNQCLPRLKELENTPMSVSREPDTLVESAVWIFNSGVNFRQYLWLQTLSESNLLLSLFENESRSIVEQKKRYARVWGIIAPAVRQFALDKRKKLAAGLLN
jgi:hypothetical protein